MIFSKYLFRKDVLNKYLWMYFATLSKTTAPVKLPISHLSLSIFLHYPPYIPVNENVGRVMVNKVNINPTKVRRYSIFRLSTSLIPIN